MKRIQLTLVSTVVGFGPGDHIASSAHTVYSWICSSSALDKVVTQLPLCQTRWNHSRLTPLSDHDVCQRITRPFFTFDRLSFSPIFTYIKNHRIFNACSWSISTKEYNFHSKEKSTPGSYKLQLLCIWVFEITFDLKYKKSDIYFSIFVWKVSSSL